MVVDLIDLPIHARRGMLKLQNRISEIEALVQGDLLVHPGESSITFLPMEDLYIVPEEIYKYIEEKYQILQRQGLSQDDINRVIGGELEIKFQQLVKQFETKHKTLQKKDLEGIVGSNIVNLTEQMISIAEKRLGKMVENAVGWKMPEDEIAFVAMYLRTITHPGDIKRGRVRVIVLTHGNVAKAMVDVVNRLLGVNYAVGIGMDLDEKPEVVLQKTIDVVKEIDEGKGVLLLVDMGSLLTLGDIITQKTGIPTRTVGRVDTVMVLEAVRKAILPDTNLDDIVKSIEKQEVDIGRFVTNKTANEKNCKLIQ
ncbi:MAG: hypothetical protein DIU66_005830 [Bacillota bacterium]